VLERRDRVRAILAVTAGVVAILGLVLLAGVYLISDEKGLPVPTTFAGDKCWLTTRGIDVLDCRKREHAEDFYVRKSGRWHRVGSGRPLFSERRVQSLNRSMLGRDRLAYRESGRSRALNQALNATLGKQLLAHNRAPASPFPQKATAVHRTYRASMAGRRVA
jgi:hypothetical protein